MVLPGKCEDSAIPQAAYSAPEENKDCKKVAEKIDLKKLPCSFGIKETTNMSQGSSYRVFEKLYKVYGTNVLSVSNISGHVQSSLFRSDIKKAGSSDEYLHVTTSSYDDDECEVDTLYYSDEKLSYPNFGEVMNCDKKEDVIWEGVKCTNCSTTELGTPCQVYIKDGLVIGVVVDIISLNTKTSYEYIFENFRTDLILNRSCDQSAVDPIPEEAFSAPAEIKECESNPPKSDASSTISAVASMIISMIMITLISLF